MTATQTRSTRTSAARPEAAPPLAQLRAAAQRPVDLSGLAVVRILFGLLLGWEVWRYFDNGWIARYYVDPAFNFTYNGFSWVRPLPGAGMEILFASLGVLALLLTVGAYTRIAAGGLTLGYTYIFLLEQARYLNHFYLLCVFALLMTVIGGHQIWSLDAAVRPGARATHGPAWLVWLLRVQIGAVYLHAGLAKLNADWLGGEPMRMWLADRTDFPVLGRWFTEEWMVYAASYGGLAFDLLLVPALLWRRTRLPAFLAAIGFHLFNERLFQIGIFPWFAMAVTTVYFRPDWPRVLLARLGLTRAPGNAASADPHGGPSAPTEAPTPRATRHSWAVRAGAWALVAFMGVQVLAPLRHHVIPGDVAWTEEGHRFSWRMKLRSKSASSSFVANDRRTGESWQVDLDDHLDSWQSGSMARPDMVAQFARYLSDHYAREGRPDVAIHARVLVSLNGREAAPLVDPFVDLASVPSFDLTRSWILPHPDTLDPDTLD